MQVTLSNFIEKSDRVNTRGYVEHLNDKSATGCNTSTYLSFVTITAKRDTLTEILPVPGSPITTNIGPLIDNERGLERGADDKGFTKGGVWGAGLPASTGSQLVDRLLGCRSDSCCFSCLLIHSRWTFVRYSLDEGVEDDDVDELGEGIEVSHSSCIVYLSRVVNEKV